MAINTGFEGQRATDHARRMVEEARAFKDAIGSQAENIGRAIDLPGRVQRHPIGMVCAAAGVGYLLGGGLFSPLTGKLLRVGLRLALIPLLKNQLANLSRASAAPGEGAAGPTF